MRLIAILALAWSLAASEPTAHAPSFDDKSVWPRLSGKERFLGQAWPKARLLVWAKPGESGSLGGTFKDAKLDSADLSNWLEDGKPATAVPDQDCDLLLPASDRPYLVYVLNQYGRNKEWDKQVVRHLTVGRNANFACGGDAVSFLIAGNCWIQKGGILRVKSGLTFVGSGHAFLRNDNDPDTDSEFPQRGAVLGSRLSQYIFFRKEGDASVEVFGHISCLDEFRINGGTVIAAPGSIIQPGRNAAPLIDRQGTLALLDGAKFYSWTNNLAIPDLEVTGFLQGGLPERPLQADAHWLLHIKNYEARACTAAWPEKAAPNNIRVASAVLHPGTVLRSFSADPAKARLRIAMAPDLGWWERRPMKGSTQEQEHSRRNQAQVAQFYPWYDALPRAGFDLLVGQGVGMDTVVLDGLRPGGLLLADPADAKGWKAVQVTGGKPLPPEAIGTAAKVGKGGKY